MLVVDVNSTFGMRPGDDLDLSLPRLLKELDSHHIALAFTCSLRGVSHDHEAGNAETLQATKTYPWLLPAATLDLRRYLGWEAEVDRCLQAGVRLFRLFPELQRWTVASAPFADLMAKLRGSDAVVMLSALEPGSATAIAQATVDYGLAVILTDANYSPMAEIIATMRCYPHLYVETNYLAQPYSVEVMAREVGVERLLFGSRAPEFSVQRALNEVLGANLTDEEKAAILGGNGLRLFGLDPDVGAGRPRLASPEMLHLPGPIIDVHCHLGRWQFPIPSDGAAGLLRLMHQAGVDRAILSSAQAIMYDLEGGNRWVAEEIAAHPELLAYVVVNPNDLALSCREMDRYYQLPNFVGAKLHLVYSGQTTRLPQTQSLLAEVARRGRPMKVHVEEEDQRGALQALRELAQTYPEWSIIKAHGGNGQLAQVVADVPNIYFEFGGSGGLSQNIRQALDVLGPDRVMFGSDADLNDMSKQIGVYHDAGMTPQERRQVLSGNAKRVFGLA